MVPNELTLDQINENFYEEDGQLKWKIKSANRIQVGNIAGYNNENGYLRVELNGRVFQVHRILYQIYNQLNELDCNILIDHIDGDPSNNRKYNLRLTDHMGNMHNARKRKDNTSGYKDIWCNRTGKYLYWRVQIRLNNVKHNKQFPYSNVGLKKVIEYRDFKLNELHGEFSNNGELR